MPLWIPFSASFFFKICLRCLFSRIFGFFIYKVTLGLVPTYGPPIFRTLNCSVNVIESQIVGILFKFLLFRVRLLYLDFFIKETIFFLF